MFRGRQGNGDADACVDAQPPAENSAGPIGPSGERRAALRVQFVDRRRPRELEPRTPIDRNGVPRDLAPVPHPASAFLVARATATLRRVSERAIVLAEGHYRTSDAKTAHGLVRGPSRWPIACVVDSTCAGADAGELLDGRTRGIPIVSSLAAALALRGERPTWCVVGIATHGGRMTPSLRATLIDAAERGLSIANGLHEPVADDERIVAAARRHGAQLVDLRKPKRASELSFWTGAALALSIPRVAVLGTDCALGKRTTAQLLVAECRARGHRAEMLFTGQTGWLQGAKHGFVLDATPNDFVAGELERALLACVREERPQIVFIEGQSALRNPGGPCGAELLLSTGARHVVLQHAPARTHFDGAEDVGCVIPPIAEELELLRFYRASVVGVTVNESGLEPARVAATCAALERELGLPVIAPLRDGVARIVERLEPLLARTNA